MNDLNHGSLKHANDPKVGGSLANQSMALITEKYRRVPDSQVSCVIMRIEQKIQNQNNILCAIFFAYIAQTIVTPKL